MVSVVHSVAASAIGDDPLALLGQGLDEASRERLGAALAMARERYGDAVLRTGEPTWRHALGMGLLATSLDLDADTRVAAVLFALPATVDTAADLMTASFGDAVANLVGGLARLDRLRPLTRAVANARDMQAQTEILRKMLLAMVEDIRVVLLRLASRVQTLRFLTEYDTDLRRSMARESLALYAPLANRLGIWQWKWELEDLSFRFLEPETYKRLARMLDERRSEREQFIATAVDRLRAELAAAGIAAEVYGRPKHLYSIWNKMRGKDLDFSEVYDVRALRIVVDAVRDCYTALGIVHHIWVPIHGEFDDYISHPKGNFYRSLHTAVMAEDGRALEVQIRTAEMHAHAELGVAAHWRYKEAGAQGKTAARAEGRYEDKIALLRQLLSWRDEVTDSAAWVEQYKRAALDDTLYVMTPQGRVIDLPRGATPVDFAYRVHTDLGHRCRGARVDGHMVTLSTPLQSGQCVEVIAAKSGGPSRDWLNPGQGILVTPRARQKVRQWFFAQEDGTVRATPATVAPAPTLAPAEADLLQPRKSRAGESRILVVGVDKLLTQTGRCCKPMPPDAISGFVTRGRGVSIHRVECRNFRNMATRNPERVIGAEWGGQGEAVYPADLAVEAGDRHGLLRDISDLLSRERINVTAMKTQSRSGVMTMALTVEVAGATALQRLMHQLREVPGVGAVRRR